MRIMEIDIKKFGSIDHATLTLDFYNVLIGRNGVGKSTILKALKFFYTPTYDITIDDFFNYQTTEPIEITVTFDKLSKEAEEEFASYVDKGSPSKNRRLIVTKKATWDGNAAIETYHGTKLEYPMFKDIRSLSGRDKTKKYADFIKENISLGLESARSQDDVDNRLVEWESLNQDKCELTIDDGRFFGFKNVGTGRLDKYTDLVCVPAVQDASEEAEEKGQSALKKLMDISIRRALNTSELVNEFKKEFDVKYKEFLQNEAFNLEPVERELGKALKRYAPRAGLSLSWQSPPDPRITEPSAIAKLKEDGHMSEVVYKGHGLQRSFLITILHFLKDVESGHIKFGKENAKDFIPGLVLAIEEPELYQHPAQARFLARTLQNLADINERGVPLQIICTSHSPYFVDVRNFNMIRVVRKNSNSQEAGGTHEAALKVEIKSTTLGEVAKRLGEAHKKEGFSAGTLAPRLITLLNPYVNEAFFADFVVVVEGEEDRAILLGAMQCYDDARDLEEKGVSIIPVNGKTNIDRLKVILDKMAIPNYVIFDIDKKGIDEENNKKTNNALLRLLGGTCDCFEQRIESDYAMFKPDFRTALRVEVGETKWNEIRDEAAKLYGYTEPLRCDKNPVVIACLFKKMSEKQISLPESLKKCLNAIVEKVGKNCRV